MNIFEKIVYFLQGEMNRPSSYGWFHLMWIGLIIISLIILYKSKYNERQLKIVLGVYGIIALLLEIIKQVIWSFDPNTLIWDYQWYAAPFQFCTTPIFISLICLFLKNNKFRNSLLSYMAFFTILGSIMTVIIPDSCFVKTIEVNIHTMWLHCGSLVVSIYLLMKSIVKIDKKNLIAGFKVFLVFAGIALLINIIIYNSGILNGETFNMFYISPYFISGLPVYNIIQENTPYLVFLLIYIITILIGGLFIYYIVKVIKILKNRKKVKKILD